MEDFVSWDSVVKMSVSFLFLFSLSHGMWRSGANCETSFVRLEKWSGTVVVVVIFYALRVGGGMEERRLYKLVYV